MTACSPRSATWSSSVERFGRLPPKEGVIKMSSKKLTDLKVKNLRPGPTAREVPDGGSGLYCVIQPSGHKSWAVRYRINGKPAKYTFDTAMTLAEARKAAIDVREQVKLGHDPKAARRAAKVNAAVAEADTVAAICERCI